MDLEENSDLESMQDAFEKEDDEHEIENAFNTEVCVICTGIVTDRGLLDSCDHWFCYECIEQWAEFSNHCPICKLVFSSIASVDDNNDSTEADESSLSIDDEDWYLKEGEIDPLYFPANFINEENVKCLESEGCKLQNGLVSYGDFKTDTSVACDSCENWYHAICVDFDPNSKYEGGWICPRCASSSSIKQPQPIITPNIISKDNNIINSYTNNTIVNNNLENETINIATSASNQFLGNVSVSVDDGETAVVVSFHKDPSKNTILHKFEDTEAIIDKDPCESVILHKYEEKENEAIMHKDPPEIFDKYEENMSDFDLLSPIREIESIMDFENKEEIKKSDAINIDANDTNMIDAIETKEYKEENLNTKSSNNIMQKPINTGKRRDMQMMMEPMAVSKKSKSNTPNIMSIITETPPNKKAINSGARTKKIMQTKNQPSNNNIKELKTEIKTLKDTLNDETLLTAFRAIIAPNKSASGAKRSFVQKGKSRNNLMKKIYSNSTGRRKSFWERDFEVEFWKNKCNSNFSRVYKEKVETLQSIIELLKNDNNREKQGQNGGKDNEILSRVYLADASVFPRKSDLNLKPLSYIGENSLIIDKNNEENKGQNENSDKSRGVLVKKENKETKKEDKLTCEIKSDKKKWALEILARKNNNSLEINKERNENLSSLKDKYPLLAQLPLDMKPVLAPGKHNKIPLAVRQAQLYRLTEHFLKQANIENVRRTAKTELAIADAVNIEKEICDKSNSKIVYLNLISQRIMKKEIIMKNNTNEIRERSEIIMENNHNNEICEKSAIIMGNKTGEISEKSEIIIMGNSNNHKMSEKRNGENTLEEILRMAGLSSDSPPNSPVKNGPNDENALGVKNGLNGENCLAVKDGSNDENTLDIKNGPNGENTLRVKTGPNDGNTLALKDGANDENTPAVEKGANDENTLGVKDGPNDETTLVVKDGLNDENTLVVKDGPNDENTLVVQNAVKEQMIEKNDENTHATEENVQKTLKLAGLSDNSPQRKEEPILEREKDGSETSKNFINNNSNNNDDDNKNNKGKSKGNNVSTKKREKINKGCESENESCAESNLFVNKKSAPVNKKLPDSAVSISTKVEAYIKEHLRPLCKSGVINVQHYRWAVAKTTEKVMKFHQKDKNANFLIKEGEKVKRLAEQYVEAAQQKGEF